MPFAEFGAVRGGRLTGEGLLFEGGWRSRGSGAQDAHSSAQQDDDGYEGERLLFGWCRHGAQDAPCRQSTIIVFMHYWSS